MKRKFTRVAAVLCGMSLLLTGCRIGNKNIVVSNILNDRQVFKIEGTVCSLKEARVYLTNYQNIYGTAYGVDLWKRMSFLQYQRRRQSIMHHFQKKKILILK